MLIQSTEPLKDFIDVRTTDPEVARDSLRSRFGLELIAPEPRAFSAESRFAQLPNFSIFWSSNTAAASVVTPSSVSTHVHLLLRGRCDVAVGQHRLSAQAEDAFVCSSGQPTRLDFHAGHEELVVLIPPATLNRTMTSLTGFTPKCAIEFEPTLDTSDPHYVGFRDLVLLLAGKLDPDFSAWPQATLEQIETACITSFLYCSRHNLRHLLDARPAMEMPKHIRIAEQFAETSAGRDIGVEDMAKESAVSVSTLTRAFLKHRGCTPAAFIKRTRLTRARDLLESRSATTVVGVALRCGFTNPSRFGKDYHQVFGETPTETLRRLRAQPMDA